MSAEALESGTISKVSNVNITANVTDEKKLEMDEMVFKMPSISSGSQNKATADKELTLPSSNVDAVHRSETLEIAGFQGKEDEPFSEDFTSNTVNNKSSPGMDLSPAQQIFKDKLNPPIPYKEPPWGSLAPPSGPGNKTLYKIEELKNGTVS